jgi:hypothetical protein
MKKYFCITLLSLSSLVFFNCQESILDPTTSDTAQKTSTANVTNVTAKVSTAALAKTGQIKVACDDTLFRGGAGGRVPYKKNKVTTAPGSVVVCSSDSSDDGDPNRGGAGGHVPFKKNKVTTAPGSVVVCSSDTLERGGAGGHTPFDH